MFVSSPLDKKEPTARFDERIQKLNAIPLVRNFSKYVQKSIYFYVLSFPPGAIIIPIKIS